MDLPNLGIETGSPALQADSLPYELSGNPIKCKSGLLIFPIPLSSCHFSHENVQFSSVQSLSRVGLFATQWTVACQAPLSMDFSRQEYWNGLPFPSSGNLPNPGIKPRSPALQEDTLPDEPQGKPKNTGVGSLSLLQQIF